MVGHRVSQAELYNDRDVIIQIMKLKDTVNDYAGGIIENIYISGNDLVIEWEDGTSVSLPLPDPVTGISSVTGNVSGGNLTITFYFTNGTTHSFTCPLAGMASEAYVDGLDAQNVKLTGDQTVGGTKSFTGDAQVPTNPAGDDSAVNSFYVNDSTGSVVNNLVHKDGIENITGYKYFVGNDIINAKTPDFAYSDHPAATQWFETMAFVDKNGERIAYFVIGKNTDGTNVFQLAIRNSDGTFKYGAISVSSDN